MTTASNFSDAPDVSVAQCLATGPHTVRVVLSVVCPSVDAATFAGHLVAELTRRNADLASIAHAAACQSMPDDAADAAQFFASLSHPLLPPQSTADHITYPASGLADDVVALSLSGFRVWSYPRAEVAALAKGDGYSAHVIADGYDANRCAERWYDDGSLVVSCNVRLPVADDLRSDAVMRLFTVYDRPSDHPGYVVVRGSTITPNTVTMDRATQLFSSVDRARAWLRQEHPNLVRLDRAPDDDPVIVEVWM